MSASPASAEPPPASGGGAVPRHVAIIMDGNGRWAKARGLPRVAGHRAGAEAARKVLRAAGEAGVECLTLYAFSSENWRRPEAEINDLMGLLRLYIKNELEALHREGIRIKVIGDHSAFAPDVAKLVDTAVARTAGNSRMTLCVALNYGSRAEIVRAVQRLASEAMVPEAIDEAAIDRALDTADLPPLDLLIRTSGEHRLSNFLLWQAAYAELLFTDTLWPDFDGEALRAALADFAGRERRFGGL
ncbi:isoprenyl transferase [Allosphingosinicella indica]|uniref:Isoprenyl transferase n=1 Tax=Allosphingosinicella indica TaxID=941907 RepID=A0A1X7GZ10_9SPHN|nr:isoprenyl transferase [Allosphingosinicella indica]SMF76481.1 Undecaprenyl pyrophosphate synthetase [Allosphingosinicella indica]